MFSCKAIQDIVCKMLKSSFAEIFYPKYTTLSSVNNYLRERIYSLCMLWSYMYIFHFIRTQYIFK